MIVWAVIIVWSVLAGVVCGGVAFGDTRSTGGNIPAARAHAYAAFAFGALLTSAILMGFAWALGLV